MKKENMKNEFIIPELKPGEELLGFFQAQYQPSILWFFLVGPFVCLAMKVYFVAVTEQGIYFHKLSILGKPETYDYFTWKEVESLKLGKGLLRAPLKVKFSNGRSLNLKAQIKGSSKLALLDTATKNFLLSKFSS